MDKRSFLRWLMAAPAVVAAGYLPVRAIERLSIPRLYGDGIHDDAPAIQAMVNGQSYWHHGAIQNSKILDGGTYRMDSVVSIQLDDVALKNCEFAFKGGTRIYLHGDCGFIIPTYDAANGVEDRRAFDRVIAMARKNKNFADANLAAIALVQA